MGCLEAGTRPTLRFVTGAANPSEIRAATFPMPQFNGCRCTVLS